MKKQNLYEGMYIISSKLSDEARNKALDKIQKGILDKGRRRLAYEIEGHKEGHYYIIYFNLPTEAVAELWHDYHLNEDLVRFITLRTEKVLEKIEFKPVEIIQ
jgi:small subunit ribosomal protein S6